jgi:hypothetical protein
LPNAMSIPCSTLSTGVVALVLTLTAAPVVAGPVSVSLSAEEFPPAAAGFADRWAELSVEERRAILTRLSSVRREQGVVSIRAGRRYGQVDGSGRGRVVTGMTIRVERRVDPDAPAFGAGFERRRPADEHPAADGADAPVRPVRGPEEVAP